MNKVNEISVAAANKLMREKKYEKAIDAYRVLIYKYPESRGFLSFNMDFCSRKMKSFSEISCQDSGEYVKNSSVADMLLHPLDLNNFECKLPNEKYVRTLLNSCSADEFTFEHFEAAVKCGITSPFQRDLLWYIGRIAAELGLTDLLKIDKNDSPISLAMLVNISRNKKDWFLYKNKLKNIVIDRRARDLLVTAPFESGEGKDILPPLRPMNENYCWNKFPIKNKTKTIYSLGTVTIGSILLNESKFIGLNLLQHYDMCDAWTLVEGACQGYPPRKVSKDGLSLDNCALQIRVFPDPRNIINFVQHGWTKSIGEDAKSELRNQYLKCCNTDFLFVIDIDEFYKSEDIKSALNEFINPDIFAVTLPQVHFWKDIKCFITGGYYDVSHIRVFRYIEGMRYVSNHNFPEVCGALTFEKGNKKFPRTIVEVSNIGYSYKEPSCFHMGFAKDYDDMRDKSDYYINRGEAVTRKITTESRAAWFTEEFPENCVVRDWAGELPAVLDSQIGVHV